uniref:Arm DNA-binding domain-containing protein n=1 Tax=Alistipes putredinis TaxID=28117 RepID=UPI003FD82ED7
MYYGKTSFSVLFYLCKTKTNRNGEVPITLRLTVNGERKEMRIHRFIDPKQRDAAKREANRSCKALNLSLDTINLRRFAYIESWIGPGNTLSLKRDRIVIPQVTTLYSYREKSRRRIRLREKAQKANRGPSCILNRTKHSDL